MASEANTDRARGRKADIAASGSSQKLLALDDTHLLTADH